MVSPCIRLCTLDPDSGICVGCGRTLTEIGNWVRYSEAERQAIMALLPGRLERHRPAAPR
jgi:predicted Fe-S protein YdhL (DUF1289 family)